MQFVLYRYHGIIYIGTKLRAPLRLFPLSLGVYSVNADTRGVQGRERERSGRGRGERGWGSRSYDEPEQRSQIFIILPVCVPAWVRLFYIFVASLI